MQRHGQGRPCCDTSHDTNSAARAFGCRARKVGTVRTTGPSTAERQSGSWGAPEKLWRGAGQGQADVVLISLGEMSLGRGRSGDRAPPCARRNLSDKIRTENSGLVAEKASQISRAHSEALSCLAEGGGVDGDAYREACR